MKFSPKKFLKIIVIDGEIIIARQLQKTLMNLGHHVPALACSGEEAIELSQKLRPDLVFMDIQLTGKIDGIQAACEIKKKFDIPIIFLSSYGDEETLRRSQEVSPYGHLIKPASESDIRIAADIAMNRRQAEQELIGINLQLKKQIQRITQSSNNKIPRDTFLPTFKRVEKVPSDPKKPLTKENLFRWIAPVALAISSLCLQKFLSDFLQGRIFFIFYPIIFLCALFGGLGPGILSSTILIFGAWYFLVPPFQEFTLINPVDQLALTLFTLSSLIYSIFGEFWRRSKNHLKEAREDATKEAQKFHTIVNSAPDGIIITNSQGKIILVNNQAELLFGFNRHELLNKEIEQLIPERFRSEHPEHSKLFFKNPKIRRFGTGNELYGLTKDGVEFPVELSLSPLVTQEGIYAISIIRNISERLQAEANQQLLATLVQSANDAIIGLDLNGTVLSWNPGAEKIFGFLKNEIIGKSIQMIVPAERHNESKEILKKLKETKEVVNFETRRLHKNNREICVSVSISPIHNQKGDVVGISKVARDITQKRQLEESLKKQSQLFESVLENMSEGVAVMSGNGKEFLIYNHKAKEITGIEAPRGEINNLSEHFGLFRPDLSRKFRDKELPGIGALKGKTQTDFEILIRNNRKNADTLISCNSKPVFDESGRIQFSINTFNDITQRKLAAQQLEQTSLELKRLNHELEQFTYMASHDLQEPLRKISNYIHLLEVKFADQLGSEGTRIIQVVATGSRRMHNLIQDLLTLFKTSRNFDSFETIQLQEVLKVALENIQILSEEKKASITHDPLPDVIGSPTLLAQVFQNIISNALKFQLDKSPEIHIGAKIEGKMALISIRDNGIGIKAKFFEKIFSPFEQLNPKHRFHGSGIGLAICKKIIERHNGKIWLESQEGIGTTFYFSLPLHQSDFNKNG